MKHIRLFLACLPLLLLAGCWGYGNSDDVVLTNDPPMQYGAVIMDRDDFESAIHVMPQQPIEKAGKIYIKDNFMFICDVNKGFHIYDYSNPTNPVYGGFLNAPGATDLAVRGNHIFVNQATDLVTMFFNEANYTVTVTKRNKDVFPPKLSPEGGIENVAANQVVVDWDEL